MYFTYCLVLTALFFGYFLMHNCFGNVQTVLLI